MRSISQKAGGDAVEAQLQLGPLVGAGLHVVGTVGPIKAVETGVIGKMVVGSGQHCTRRAEILGRAAATEQRPKPLKSLMTAISF